VSAPLAPPRLDPPPPLPDERVPMTQHRHDPDLADQDVEEVAEDLWTLEERGVDRLEALSTVSRVSDLTATLERMSLRGLVRLENGRVALSASGRRLAERQVRRRRLGETLFTTVLEVGDEQAVDRTACVMEHVVDGAITDSICAFL